MDVHFVFNVTLASLLSSFVFIMMFVNVIVCFESQFRSATKKGILGALFGSVFFTCVASFVRHFYPDNFRQGISFVRNIDHIVVNWLCSLGLTNLLRLIAVFSTVLVVVYLYEYYYMKVENIKGKKEL